MQQFSFNFMCDGSSWLAGNMQDFGLGQICDRAKDHLSVFPSQHLSRMVGACLALSTLQAPRLLHRLKIPCAPLMIIIIIIQEIYKAPTPWLKSLNNLD